MSWGELTIATVPKAGTPISEMTLPACKAADGPPIFSLNPLRFHQSSKTFLALRWLRPSVLGSVIPSRVSRPPPAGPLLPLPLPPTTREPPRPREVVRADPPDRDCRFGAPPLRLSTLDPDSESCRSRLNRSSISRAACPLPAYQISSRLCTSMRRASASLAICDRTSSSL